MGWTSSYVGYGIIVPFEVFQKVFPQTLDQEGYINEEFLQSLKTPQVDLHFNREDRSEGIFIVGAGYYDHDSNEDEPLNLDLILSQKALLDPWLASMFPGFKPGIYNYVNIYE